MKFAFAFASFLFAAAIIADSAEILLDFNKDSGFKFASGWQIAENRGVDIEKGKSLQFNGSNYISIRIPDSYVFKEGFTLECVITGADAGAGRIIDRSTPGTSDSICLDTHPGKSLRLITPIGVIGAENSIQPGKSCHVCAVYDPLEGTLQLFLDGKSVAVRECATMASIAGKDRFVIGADTVGGNRFKGSIDRIRIYDLAISPDDVMKRFENKEIKLNSNIVQEEPETCYRDGIQINRKALLSRNDIVYLSPAIYEYESLPLGNGRMCAMVWNKDGINLQINHANNIWFQSSSGRMRIITEPSLADGTGKFVEKLSLYDETVNIESSSKAGEWKASATVFEGMDVLAVHFEGKLRTSQISFELEQWRDSAKDVSTGKYAGFEETLDPGKGKEKFSRKMALLAGADCPLKICETRKESGSKKISFILSPTKDKDGITSFTVYVANPLTYSDGNPLKEAEKLLDAAIGAGWNKCLQKTTSAWEEFWKKSFVHLKSPDRAADYMENLWYLHLYWMNCAGRGEMPVKFNGGAFLPHKDNRGWGTRYWYQNSREPYWPLTVANHMELLPPFQNLYRSVLPVEMEMTKKLFNVDGAQYQETMAIDGDGDKNGNPYTCLYLTTGMEMTYFLYVQYLFTRDEEMLKNIVYPVMRETVRFYTKWLKKESDGLYHLYPCDGKETYWRVKDAITDLCAVKRMFPIFIGLAGKMNSDSELSGKCREILDKLAPFPMDREKGTWAPCVFLKDPPDTGNPLFERVYTPANTSHSITESKNSENVECETVYPWEFDGLGKPGMDIAVKTLKERRFKPASGWDPAAIQAARLGLADEATYEITQHCMSSQRWPQGFWNSPAGAYWIDNLVDCPYFDSSGVNAMSTCEMLLQSYDGIIRVWPAAHKKWNGVFNLRSQTGFMVSSERSCGEINFIEIESIFGDECKITNPWDGKVIVTCNGKKVDTAGNEKDIVFKTEKGRKYLVVPEKRSDAKFRKIEPDANNDVKRIGLPSKKKNTPAEIRPPMLGITGDGLTYSRIKLRDMRKKTGDLIAAATKGKQKIQISAASRVDRNGKILPSQWLIDGVFGVDNIGSMNGYDSYVLELKEPADVSALVWSYNRNDGRCDCYQRISKIKILSSDNGSDWQEAASADYANSLFGQPITFGKPLKAKFIKIIFADSSGKNLAVPCDEIELY